ncbi:MAG: FAD-dependent monooxygenase [Pseudonocardiaceae bacterium]
MVSTNTPCEVLIAGAGPTGLTLACNLLASGVSVRVVDKARGPAITSRALGLMPRGVEVLDRAGALGDLEQRANPLRQVVVDLGSRETAYLRMSQTTKLVTRPGLLISQAEIEASLRRRLAELGGAVEWGAEVLHAGQDAEGVRVQFSDGRTAPCHWIVGCDGAHSRVRNLAGIGFPGVRIIERFLLADVHADLPVPRDSAAVWLHGAGMLGAFPLPGKDLWRLMAPAPDNASEDGSNQDVQKLLTHILHERSGCPLSAVRATVWTSTFRIHRRLANRFRQGRMLVAGDAAHIHSPTGGQGMNTGVGDAENLAWKLSLVVHGDADTALLDSYEAERRPIATEVLRSTSALTEMVLGDTRLARVLRDHVFVRSLDLPLVQRLIWESASQLKISYRRGPLAGTSGWPFRTGPLPGDRVADLPCLRLDGTPTRLYAELGGRWALLTPSSTPTQVAQACVDRARDRLGTDTVTVLTPPAARPTQVVLVRPDGHAGWCGQPSPTALDAWLTGILRHGCHHGQTYAAVGF